MEKNLKYAVNGTITLALVLLAVNIFLSRIKISDNIRHPTGDSYSIISSLSKAQESNYIVYGFLPYWSLDKTGYFQLDKLTDIAYFALIVEKDGRIKTHTEDGFVEPGYNNWRNSKNLESLINEGKKYGIRFSLTIVSHEDPVTIEFLNCKDCWSTLASELTEQLRYREITNLNFDFESVDEIDKDFSYKYSALVSFVNSELDKEFGDSYVVTSTLPDSMIKQKLTHIESLAKVSDAIFIMAYDFHRPTSETAGPIAPISGAGRNREYDLTSMLKDYLSVSPPNKLILGVPYYGYNWKVTDFRPKSERIAGNDETGFSISQTYKDIMEVVFKYRPSISWDVLSQSPYFSYINEEKGYVRRQVYFENKESIRAKYWLAKDNNLAGIGIWALGYDGGYQELWDLLGEEFGK